MKCNKNSTLVFKKVDFTKFRATLYTDSMAGDGK